MELPSPSHMPGLTRLTCGEDEKPMLYPLLMPPSSALIPGGTGGLACTTQSPQRGRGSQPSLSSASPKACPAPPKSSPQTVTGQGRGTQTLATLKDLPSSPQDCLTPPVASAPQFTVSLCPISCPSGCRGVDPRACPGSHLHADIHLTACLLSNLT